ncbi:GNAT family N-acetyltransferase [Pannonibacter tanglangensis]|uniref:GNAT family N-acetyltransferase n=1 Tax=Pannonibacter tanglangensis TaxID=2750084 RepID=A0ABW9ZL73_9HYPH|nr:GNAT family N-acetyltransferase [Pannonibacter sp. XCT-34]NBN65591.1 GNAT family N-acetyltransferase [Pannonibacter sp. XCT-34]
MFSLETDRLLLRPWEDADLDAFAAMNADPEVMRHFPAVMSPAETAAMMARMRSKLATDGFGVFPVIRKADGRFVGFVGLNRPAYPVRLPFDPCVEFAWRLVRDAWGQGYATEAARAWMRFGFETLDLDEIVAFTAAGNRASRRVMERLGMARSEADDFLHPVLPADHPLAPHVLYRLPRAVAGS